MGIEAGSRLGPYEIVAPIGAGGMGEVYRARDTRLGREVAVKILAPHLSASSDSRQRFEREARAVSSLNHPNICTLHDVGQQDGIHYLVMELLEGETVAARLARGPMPLDETLRVASQVADALNRAHRQGIVHRDLKPGNVMLTKAGAKLLDFGLARAGAGPDSGAVMAGMTADATLATPLTAQGHIVGTFQYMAPEQLEGREADARSDIFSFGTLLYEMITSRRAFVSANAASLIATILKEEPPPLQTFAPSLPESLDRLVRICLAKDPDQRWQSAGDLSRELVWIGETVSRGPAPASPPVSGPGMTTSGGAPAPSPASQPPASWPAPQPAPAPPTSRRAARAGWIVAIIMATLALDGWWIVWRRGALTPAPPPAEIRFTIDAPPGGSLPEARVNSDFAIAPDNSRIVFVAAGSNGAERLWVREFRDLTPMALPGTEGATGPFWSPDGQSIAFFAQRKLKRISLAGGAPQALCDARATRGAWSPRGVILFGGRPLLKVSENGGSPEPVLPEDALPEAVRMESPAFLPDGERFFFLAGGAAPDKRAIYVGSLAGGAPRKLIDSPFKASWIEPGMLVQVSGDALTARPFDAERGEATGEPSILAQEVALALVPGLSGYSATSPRAIAWRKAAPQRATEMRWYDRSGKDLGATLPAAADISLELSPDGRHAAVGRVTLSGPVSPGGEPPTHIFITDLSRGVSTRLTVDTTRSDENPVWSPDGSLVAFASHLQGGPSEIFIRSASGAEAPRPLAVGTNAALMNPHPVDWTPDGRSLLVQTSPPNGQMDLALVEVTSGAVTRLTQAESQEGQGQLSPDGRSLLYVSNESGEQEVYVMTIPDGKERLQVSATGGFHPRWRADGREVYYLDPNGMLMAATFAATPRLTVSAPAPLFEAPPLGGDFNFYGGQAGYDVSPDGQRFLVNHIVTRQDPAPINVLLNWDPSVTGK